jgi:serine/threonine protein kinase
MLNVDDKIGEYVLVEYIDSGGFGEVWKAEKKGLDTFEFALKFFRPKNEEGVNLEKVKKEVLTSKTLRGAPHIVSIIEAGMFKNYIYIVSEFAEGGSLGSWLKANGGKAPSYDAAVEIAIEILRGLESMHKQGIVHRDLKPDNILIKNGFFCLADFGISREIKTNSKATKTAGTYEYMSPEAFESHVSIHTDIWAVGVILQELLTGKLPYPQEFPAIVYAIMHAEPEPMPDDVPKPLREIVEKALRRDRNKRFKSAKSMREALRDFLRPTVEDDIDAQNELEEYKTTVSELKKQLEEAQKIIEESEKRRQEQEVKQASETERKPRNAEHQPAIMHEGYLKADEFYKAGYRHFVSGEYDLAIKNYNEAIGLNANYSKAYNKRGMAHHKKNNFVQAIRDFDKAIEINPTYMEAYNNRGNSYCSKKNYELAVKDFNKALELNPKNATAYKNRATAYDKMGDIEKAEADLKEYQKLTQKPDKNS